MPYVHFGNTTVKEGYRDPESNNPDLVRHRRADIGEQITEILIPEGWRLQEAFNTVVVAMDHHLWSDETEEGLPPWCESDWEALKDLLVDHYNLGDNRRPADYGAATGAPLAVSQRAMTMMGFQVAFLGALGLYVASKALLRTNFGRDFQASVMSNTASNGTGAYAPACWIGVTADNAVPAATDLTLPGEITSGTLSRAQAAYAHTTGTGTYTLTKLFISDQNITLAKLGVYQVATGGTLVFETLLTAPAEMVSGDQLQLTETVSL